MKHIFSRINVGIYTLFVLFISVIPVKPGGSVPFLDKIAHFFIYFLLSFLIVNTLFLGKSRHPYLYGFSYAFVLGLIIECAQFFLPYRSFELSDLACNFLGCSAGIRILILKDYYL